MTCSGTPQPVSGRPRIYSVVVSGFKVGVPSPLSPFILQWGLGRAGPEPSRAPALTRVTYGICPDTWQECSRGLSGGEPRRKREKTTSLPLKRPGIPEQDLGAHQPCPPNVPLPVGTSWLTPRFLGSHHDDGHQAAVQGRGRSLLPSGMEPEH